MNNATICREKDDGDEDVNLGENSSSSAPAPKSCSSVRDETETKPLDVVN